MVRSLPTATGERTLGVLRDAANAFANVRHAGHSGFDLYNAYMRTAADQLRLLASVLSGTELDRLVTTPRYWMLHSIDPSGKAPVLSSLLSLELDEKITTLESAALSVNEEMLRYASADVILLPDTNVLLHHAQSLMKTDWAALVGAPHRTLVAIPLVIIDELDRAKRSNEKSGDSGETLRARAGRTLSALEGWFQAGHTHELSNDPQVEVALVLDDRSRPRWPDNDAEIIDTAVEIKNLSGKRTVVVSLDLGMRLRARIAGLEAISTESTKPDASLPF